MKMDTMLLGCILALAAATSAYGAGSFDGNWVGKTLQDKAVSFEIEDGTLKSFTLGWKIPLDEPCMTTPGSPVAMTVLGGTDTLFFPYTKEKFELLKSQGETRIDPSTVRPTVGQKGFEVNRDLGGKARLNVIAMPEADGSMSGTATITAITCKGTQKLSWTAHKES